MENALSIDTWHKCKKEILGSNHVFVPCRWQGVLEEYTGHVKRQHSESYLVLVSSEVQFNWTVPYVGDRSVKSLLQFRNVHIVYEWHYDGTSRQLQHRFLPYGMDMNTGYRYEILEKEIRHEADGNLIVYEVHERTPKWTLRIQPMLID